MANGDDEYSDYAGGAPNLSVGPASPFGAALTGGYNPASVSGDFPTLADLASMQGPRNQTLADARGRVPDWAVPLLDYLGTLPTYFNPNVRPVAYGSLAAHRQQVQDDAALRQAREERQLRLEEDKYVQESNKTLQAAMALSPQQRRIVTKQWQEDRARAGRPVSNMVRDILNSLDENDSAYVEGIIDTTNADPVIARETFERFGNTPQFLTETARLTKEKREREARIKAARIAQGPAGEPPASMAPTGAAPTPTTAAGGPVQLQAPQTPRFAATPPSLQGLPQEMVTGPPQGPPSGQVNLYAPRPPANVGDAPIAPMDPTAADLYYRRAIAETQRQLDTVVADNPYLPHDAPVLTVLQNKKISLEKAREQLQNRPVREDTLVGPGGQPQRVVTDLGPGGRQRNLGTPYAEPHLVDLESGGKGVVNLRAPEQGATPIPGTTGQKPSTISGRLADARQLYKEAQIDGDPKRIAAAERRLAIATDEYANEEGLAGKRSEAIGLATERARQNSPLGPERANKMTRPSDLTTPDPKLSEVEAAAQGYRWGDQTVRDKAREARNLSTFAEGTLQLAPKIITAENAGQALRQGLALDFGAWTGMNSNARLYRDQKKAFIGNLSRDISAEKGVLTNEDINRVDRAFPSFYDTGPVSTAKSALLRNLMDLQSESREAAYFGLPQPTGAREKVTRILDQLDKLSEEGNKRRTKAYKDNPGLADRLKGNAPSSEKGPDAQQQLQDRAAGTLPYQNTQRPGVNVGGRTYVPTPAD